MAAWTKTKRKQVCDCYGSNCWLCKEPITSPEAFTLDHYVPRKWGGNNKVENLRPAHAWCNGQREKLYPESFLFTDEELHELTNPHHAGGLSRKAQKGLQGVELLRRVFNGKR